MPFSTRSQVEPNADRWERRVNDGNLNCELAQDLLVSRAEGSDLGRVGRQDAQDPVANPHWHAEHCADLDAAAGGEESGCASLIGVCVGKFNEVAGSYHPVAETLVRPESLHIGDILLAEARSEDQPQVVVCRLSHQRVCQLVVGIHAFEKADPTLCFRYFDQDHCSRFIEHLVNEAIPSYVLALLRDQPADSSQVQAEQVISPVDEALERPYVDRERLGIYGSSYGGYMTAWAITQTRRFKAAVSRAPIFDLESFYGTSDIGYTWSTRQFGGPPHERRDWYAARSPSTFAQSCSSAA